MDILQRKIKDLEHTPLTKSEPKPPQSENTKNEYLESKQKRSMKDSRSATNDIYDDDVLKATNRNPHTNLKNIYEDIKIKEERTRNPIDKILDYVAEKGFPKEYAFEDRKEKYLLLDWIAMQLTFTRSIKAKQMCLTGEPSSQKTLICQMLARAIQTK